MTRLAVIACCLPLLGFAVPSAAAEKGQVDIDAMSVPQLRREIEKFEKEIYRVFNLRTGDESLHVICRSYTPTGSNISREACEPNFLTEARANNAKNYQDGLDELLDTEALLAEVEPEFLRFHEAMTALSEEYDYFRELNIILGALRQRMAELRN
ncbi:MAG: hypothetical protein OXE80_11380 [Gammaproteobacteria bacterium]|nr:hypothetical protein [Gammaproteobacteria bacterium]